MKKVFSFIVAISVIMLLAACGNFGSASGDRIIIRASTSASQGHSSHLGLEEFKRLVEEKSNGEITVEVYHSGQLGDDRSSTEAVQLGIQEVVVASDANVAPFVPELNVLAFPYLFPNSEVAHKVLDGEIGQELLKSFEEKNMIGLGFMENGFRNITNSKKPIESVNDLEGLKLRVMNNDVHIDFFRTLGANPTPMAFTELYTGLQQGAVDAQENPNALIYQSKFHEVQKYLTETRHVYSAYAFLMNKKFFESLSEEHQKIIQESAEEAVKFQREENARQDEEAKELMIESGIQYNEISEEVFNEMREKAQPIIEKYSGKVGEEIVEKIYNAVDEASKQ